LFQSDTDLDTVEILDDSAELDKVKQKIVADPAKYTFPKIENPEDTNDKKPDTDDGIDEDLIHVSLYKPSHPVSQVRCKGDKDCFTSACPSLFEPSPFKPVSKQLKC
jgi:hypothetical protein